MNDDNTSLVSIDDLTAMLPAAHEAPEVFHLECLLRLAQIHDLESSAQEQLGQARRRHIEYRSKMMLALRRSEDPANPLTIETGGSRPTEKSIEAYIALTPEGLRQLKELDRVNNAISTLKSAKHLIEEYISYVKCYSSSPIEVSHRDSIDEVFSED